MRLPRVGKLSVNVNEMYYQFARVSISTQLLLISRQFHSTGCTVRRQPAVWPDARARPAAVRPATARATCARCQPTDLR
ncbi:regulatory PchR domain protein [Burkholderia pseudomallei MSHR5608]|nr:regulatory PchR domain protein [Burkholderia pseudomallei MSHR5608]